MPEISRFYGMIVRMYLKSKEHEPPHIHIEYSGHECLINLRTCARERGKIPARALGMVIEWTEKNQDKLLEMWETGKIEKLPPLD